MKNMFLKKALVSICVVGFFVLTITVFAIAFSSAQQAFGAEKSNTVTMYGGYGPTGIRQVHPNAFELNRNFVFGLGYKWQLDEEVNLDFIGLSNGSALMGMGYSF